MRKQNYIYLISHTFHYFIELQNSIVKFSKSKMNNTSNSNLSIIVTQGSTTSHQRLKRKREWTMSPIRQQSFMDPPGAPLKNKIDKTLILKIPSFNTNQSNRVKKDLNTDLYKESFDPDSFVIDLTCFSPRINMI
jgi:hypothetical protein